MKGGKIRKPLTCKVVIQSSWFLPIVQVVTFIWTSIWFCRTLSILACLACLMMTIPNFSLQLSVDIIWQMVWSPWRSNTATTARRSHGSGDQTSTLFHLMSWIGPHLCYWRCSTSRSWSILWGQVWGWPTGARWPVKCIFTILFIISLNLPW